MALKVSCSNQTQTTRDGVENSYFQYEESEAGLCCSLHPYMATICVVCIGPSVIWNIFKFSKPLLLHHFFFKCDCLRENASSSFQNLQMMILERYSIQKE